MCHFCKQIRHFEEYQLIPIGTRIVSIKEPHRTDGVAIIRIEWIAQRNGQGVVNKLDANADFLPGTWRWIGGETASRKLPSRGPRRGTQGWKRGNDTIFVGVLEKPFLDFEGYFRLAFLFGWSYKFRKGA